MIEDGYRPTKSGSMTSAAMAFMRDHGVLKDIYSESTGTAHKTAKGTKVSVRTVKAPGFGPKGVLRCVLPFTVFLKLKDIGGNVLPPYDEEFREVAMDTAQAAAYRDLAGRLTQELKQALAKRDTTLLGVVLNVLLAWPDCCFRSETVVHPRTRNTLAFVPAQFNELEVMPKERELIEICKQEKAEGRKTLVYSVYTGTRDTTSRLKVLLEQEGFKVAVLRASVDASRREDWIAEQLDRGIDVLITNPELVKTGLDLLEFPTIVFLQSGYNVYSLQQAARRSWRIGQKQPVRVIYLGYANSSQMTCLGLMARKIMVSQSTSGDVPESGLDVLNRTATRWRWHWHGSLSRSDPCHAGGPSGRRLSTALRGRFLGRMTSMAPPAMYSGGRQCVCLLPAGQAAAMVRAPCSREAPSMQPSICAVHRLALAAGLLAGSLLAAGCATPRPPRRLCQRCRPHRQPPSRRSRVSFRWPAMAATP